MRASSGLANAASARGRAGSGGAGSYGSGLPQRARGAQWVVVAVFAILALRLFHLQVLEHDRLLSLARENAVREEVLPAVRGVMRDREGRVLVDSEPSCSVAIDPFDPAFRVPGRLDRVLSLLGGVLQLEPEVMAETIARSKGSSYRPVFLKHHLDSVAVATIDEHRDQLPGVSIQVEPRRRYVYGQLAAHFLGYVGEITDQEITNKEMNHGGRGGEAGPGARNGGGKGGEEGGDPIAARTYRSGDIIGREGVEVAFENSLCGQNGYRMVEVNALGRRPDVLTPLTPFAEVRRPIAGEEMVLTLDLDLQQAAEAAFPEGRSGAAIMIDARTGEVLVCLSRPAFDPNEFAKGLSGAAWKALDSDSAHPLHNRALRSAYPPGSVFKVVTGAAALSHNAVSPSEIMRSCVGGYQFGARFFRCHKTHGPLAFSDAMMVSCDTYFYQAGLRVGLDTLAATARQLGFDNPAGIELGDKRGLIPDTAWYDRNIGAGRWTKGLVLNLAIGQGEILATPIQLAVMMAAVGTGQLVVPRVVKQIGDGPGIGSPRRRPLPLAPDVRSRLVAALERVVGDNGGTGGRARVPGVRVAGKTGTAQNPHGQDHALFAAFAPVESPEVAVAVVVENVGHGGEFAAPVAGKIMSAYFAQKQATLEVASKP